MRYKITVSRGDWVKGIAGKEWRQIDKEGKYDYTPEIEKTEWQINEIYSQTVEQLDLVAVIAAVNGLKGQL